MSSKILQAIHESFGESEPIFKVDASNNRQCIRLDVLNPYTPTLINNKDPVENLMIEYYSERVSAACNKFEKVNTCDRVYFSMIGCIRSTFTRYSPLKNPRQSKMFKWLYKIENQYNTPYSDGLVMLYRYIKNNQNSGGRFDGDNNNPHVKNILAILERMKEKYEQEGK